MENEKTIIQYEWKRRQFNRESPFEQLISWSSIKLINCLVNQWTSRRAREIFDKIRRRKGGRLSKEKKDFTSSRLSVKFFEIIINCRKNIEIWKDRKLRVLPDKGVSGCSTHGWMTLMSGHYNSLGKTDTSPLFRCTSCGNPSSTLSSSKVSCKRPPRLEPPFSLTFGSRQYPRYSPLLQLV